MTRVIVTLLTLGLLAGCGANGAPFYPTANVGLSAGPGGVSPSCNLGTSNGTITLSVAC